MFLKQTKPQYVLSIVFVLDMHLWECGSVFQTFHLGHLLSKQMALLNSTPNCSKISSGNTVVIHWGTQAEKQLRCPWQTRAPWCSPGICPTIDEHQAQHWSCKASHCKIATEQGHAMDEKVTDFRHVVRQHQKMRETD